MDKIEDKFENLNVTEKTEEPVEEQNHPSEITPEYVINL